MHSEKASALDGLRSNLSVDLKSIIAPLLSWINSFEFLS